MASHLKGVAKSTMSEQIRKELCEYKRDNPASTQKDLQRWLEGKFQLKVSQGTISNTLKRSNDYLSAEIEKGRAEIKRHKPAKYPDMEKVVYEWFLQHQERVNITGELILQKARDTMKLLYPHDDSDFNFSTGWLGKFKHRHGIKSFRRFVESGSVDVQDMEQKLVSIREKIDQFPMKDVFNMDETGLFYRLQVDHSLATKQLEGRKQDKERLTYRANKKAWMTSVLFDEYVRSFDQMMHGRRVLLVVDNCPAHPRNIEGLRNVELFFLPPNMTSKIQP
ncbi:CENP-B homolog protein 2-like [Medicago truncatula]|uniref:CENP-B homolog protein 2-like n=1 Tax=Medicago truncatula TaxID=3880 RepID=UPI000D2F218B|nr:CENP-B homolog protein 2-like [Medicago truncatula]